MLNPRPSGESRAANDGAVCPRCTLEVMSSPGKSHSWTCPHHGDIDPLLPAAAFAPQTMAQLFGGRVPAWLPWPLPTGWSVSGLRWTHDGVRYPRAVAVACTGPGPFGGLAELVLVAEEPGVGLGARYAGLDLTDPGPDLSRLAPDTRIRAGGRPTPMWCLPEITDRVVYVGEAAGSWLWASAWPADAWTVIHDDLTLIDLRDPGLAYEVPAGDISAHLRQ